MVALPPMPAAIVKLAATPAPTPPPPPPMGSVGIGDGRASAYVREAVEREVAKVAGAANGSRNNTLNEAAFALGTLVGSPWAGLAENDVTGALLSAAMGTGLKGPGALRTIKSGLAGGRAKPRPEPDELRDDRGDGLDTSTMAVGGRSAAPKAEPPKRVRASDLEHMSFPPIQWCVKGYVAEGLTLFAGAPKIGKSWWCLDVAVAVASGGVAFDTVPCEQGDVLYCALEDNNRRLMRRMQRVLPGGGWPRALEFQSMLPGLDVGGVGQIADWIAEADNPRLVIVDTFAMVRPEEKAKSNAYQADTNALKPLQALASETGVAILVVHHVRKMFSDDPLQMVSGTNGLTGVVDTTLVLARGPDGVTLYGRGRDVEEIETAMRWEADRCRWAAIGDAAEVRRTDERSAILDTLRDAGEAMGPREVSDLTGHPYEATRKTMQRMARAGELEKSGRGLYTPCPNGPNVPTDDECVDEQGDDDGTDWDTPDDGTVPNAYAKASGKC